MRQGGVSPGKGRRKLVLWTCEVRGCAVWRVRGRQEGDRGMGCCKLSTRERGPPIGYGVRLELREGISDNCSKGGEG